MQNPSNNIGYKKEIIRFEYLFPEEEIMSPRSTFSTWGGILNLINLIRPNSILDIGVGFGKAGFLIREYFDLKPDKKKGYADWSIQIDGIEIFEKYLTPIHNYIYNDIFIGDAIDILKNSNSYYDLILAIDVIEHFNKNDGYTLIDLCKEKSTTALISTPDIFYKQGNEFFNEHETHLSGWDVSDFKEKGSRYTWTFGISLVAVFSEKQLNIPVNENSQGNILHESDLLKIEQLIQMYFQTRQYKECIEACIKYSAFFPNEEEFSRIIALCTEKLNPT
jgi:hypothetical protein